jgi:CRISPR system Cascade subunit CasC
MFVELHMIQSFAPANLNRDDTNNPKDCEFGGVRRARISSQCIKRAIRQNPAFKETTGAEIGMRTKWLMSQLRQPLLEAGKPEDEVDAILPEVVAGTASKLDSKSAQKTAVLLYLSRAEIDNLVQTLVDRWDALADEKQRSGAVKALARDFVKTFKGRTSAPDIALFGRMLAEKPALNIDAACQVAHAISTHRVTMEMDFYTALDDLNPDDTTAAGMMGFTGYNSACFYRYARIDWGQLAQNLGGDVALARRTVEGFLRAAVAAVPSGKQNSFAAQNPPEFLLAVVRNRGMGWSLTNAFERPVRPQREGGLVAPSVAALDSYWDRVRTAYGGDSVARVAALTLQPALALEALADSGVADLEAWVAAVMEALPDDEEAGA